MHGSIASVLRILLAWAHLLALAIGFAAVVTRAGALRSQPLDGKAVQRAMAADAWWGIAALLWLSTGLWRWLGGTEKASGYYLRNAAFHAKLGMFGLILLLELWPMITLVRWRRARGQAGAGGPAWTPPEREARRVALLSTAEGAIVLAIVLAATLMARGYGSFGTAG